MTFPKDEVPALLMERLSEMFPNVSARRIGMDVGMYHRATVDGYTARVQLEDGVVYVIDWDYAGEGVTPAEERVNQLLMLLRDIMDSGCAWDAWHESEGGCLGTKVKRELERGHTPW